MRSASFTFFPILSLIQRELLRFYRQRSRIMGTLGTPLVFWIFLGSGLSAAFPTPSTPGGRGFLEYFFPGTLTLTLLFTSVFSCISIIEDRHQGFLQGVLVAPISKIALVGGKVWGGTLIALIQGALFLLVAPAAGFSLGFSVVVASLVGMLVSAFMLTALGFLFAWRLDSVQGFHSIMNLLLFPMWLLSGAFFPLSGAPFWLRGVMYVNPLTYGLASLEGALYWGRSTHVALDYWVALGVTLLFGLIFYALCMVVVAEQPKKGLA
jgi:ABC-2 type transport system permease protein